MASYYVTVVLRLLSIIWLWLSTSEWFNQLIVTVLSVTHVQTRNVPHTTKKKQTSNEKQTSSLTPT